MAGGCSSMLAMLSSREEKAPRLKEGVWMMSPIMEVT